jgi:hypothetical protein
MIYEGAIGVPSPICLGSVSPSPYKVARHKPPPEHTDRTRGPTPFRTRARTRFVSISH